MIPAMRTVIILMNTLLVVRSKVNGLLSYQVVVLLIHEVLSRV